MLAAEKLSAYGLSPTIADARFAKPLDTDLIAKLAREHEVLITIEEGAAGGFGAHVMQFLAWEGLMDKGLKVRPMTLPDIFQDHDTPEHMYAHAGLDADGIVKVGALRARPQQRSSRRHGPVRVTRGAMRADVFLVEQGYAKSRSEAQAAIKAGLVRVAGALLSKPSQTIARGAAIEYRRPHPFVSRGGVKLAAALDHFGLSPQDRTCLDLGASTGGFTQVLLERGAGHVHAVDVGHGQMDQDLACDPRVSLHEGVNARDLSGFDFGRIEAVTADLSFISLKLALPPALALAAQGAWLSSLVKPQFEVGRDAIGKGGIVRDAETREPRAGGNRAFHGRPTPGWRCRARWKVRSRAATAMSNFFSPPSKA